MNDDLLPRLASECLTDRLRVMPAVVFTGARQTGKSTLAPKLAPGGNRTYFSLDDLDVVDAARRDPIEVNPSANPRLGDARHLLTFRTEYGRKARAGLLLHTGRRSGGLLRVC